eukprot:12316404-Alexandrium_andersonii.AAC.1
MPRTPGTETWNITYETRALSALQWQHVLQYLTFSVPICFTNSSVATSPPESPTDSSLLEASSQSPTEEALDAAITAWAAGQLAKDGWRARAHGNPLRPRDLATVARTQSSHKSQ